MIILLLAVLVSWGLWLWLETLFGLWCPASCNSGQMMNGIVTKRLLQVRLPR